MLYAVLVLAGIGIGIIFTTVVKHNKSVGILHIDNSYPEEGPQLFLKLTRDVHEIHNMDYVTMEVKIIKHTTHE